MKKILPVAMLALAATAVSCSNDNDNGLKNPTKDAISFSRPYVINSVKEKTGSSNIDFNSFKVWGLLTNPTTQSSSYIFSGDDVTKQNNDTWHVRTEYWYPNMEYYFTGIAPGEAFSNQSISFSPMSTENHTPYNGGGTITFDNNLAKGRVDLVYAWAPNEVYSKDRQPVSLTFKHLLSQIFFSFSNQVSESTSLVITDMELIGSYNKGTIDETQKDANWTPMNVTSNFPITEIGSGTTEEDKLTFDEKNSLSEAIYIIPTNTQQEFTLKFRVIVYNGNVQVANNYNHSVKLPSLEFAQGESYRFNAIFNADNLNPDGALEPIKFTVTEVSDWENVDGGNITPTPGN